MGHSPIKLLFSKELSFMPSNVTLLSSLMNIRFESPVIFLGTSHLSPFNLVYRNYIILTLNNPSYLIDW